MSFSAADYRYMSRALRLAARGLNTTSPNPRVGCVLVSGNEIVGEGWHERAGGPHAEVVALRAAGERARGATAYVTLEPCCHHGRTPPCSEALLAAGVARVVAAMEDPNPRVAGKGLAQLHAAGVEVSSGLLTNEAERLNPGFIKRMRNGRPFVRVKLAMSLDGRTAMASGESRWITGEAARADVQRLRARSCAVVTGSGTVLADDPALNVRLGESVRQPLRVVVDSQLRVPATAKIFTGPGKSLVVAAIESAGAMVALKAAGADVTVLPSASRKVSLETLLDHLAAREINEVLVEAGPRLAGAFVASDLVDELVIYVAPKLLGDAARGLLHLPGLDTMAQAKNLEILDLRQVGKDLRLTARVTSP